MFATPAFAEDATGSGTVAVVDSGAIIQEHISVLAGLLGSPLPSDGAQVFLSANKQKSWEEELGRYKQKIASFRATCRATIRKANRDSLMSQSSACFRGDLLLQVSFLRKQQIYISSLPGISEQTLSGATFAINNLVDAEMTIVDAIDAKLFQTMDDLTNTKQKLLTQYRAPYWLALSKIRANQQLTIISLMLKRTIDMVTDGMDTPLLQKSTLEALSCLTDATERYQSILHMSGSQNAEEIIAEANKALPACRDSVWYLARLKNRQETPSTENAPQQ